MITTPIKRNLGERVLAALPDAPPGFQPNEARFYVLGQIVLPLGFVVHVGFMLLFWYLDQTVLAVFNVLSLVLFSVSIWQHYKRVMTWTMYLVVLFELPVHAALATAYLGISAGFWLHIIITITFLMLYPFFSKTTKIVFGFVFAFIMSVIVIYGQYNEPINPVSIELYTLFMTSNIVVLAFILIAIIASYDSAVEKAESALQLEFSRAEALLLNILPVEIATRLKAQEEPLADAHESVSVLFADLAGFTDLSRKMSANDLVNLLNDLFSRFDKLAAEHGAEKIKTIGDAYMVATGLSGSLADHAEKIADLALGMQKVFGEFRRDNKIDLKMRIGVHSGAVIAGVIGKQKFSYDLWGNTVNVASRMESEGIADQIQISAETWEMLSDRYQTSPRGEIQIKGHRSRETYLLEGHA